MSWDEDFPSWFRARRRVPFIGYNMNELMKEFEKMTQEVFREFEERVPRDLIREKRLPDGTIRREMGPFVYGYNMTIGPDGKPVIREFGNVRPSVGRRRPIEVADKREPLVDVVEEEDKVKVIAEIPGVEKEDIKLQVTETNLSISVEAERRYYKSVDLPVKVNPENSKASYRNGILEVTLMKTEPRKPKGKNIQVD